MFPKQPRHNPRTHPTSRLLGRNELHSQRRRNVRCYPLHFGNYKRQIRLLQHSMEHRPPVLQNLQPPRLQRLRQIPHHLERRNRTRRSPEKADSRKNTKTTEKRPVALAPRNGSRMGRRRKPLLPAGTNHKMHQRHPNLLQFHRQTLRKILRRRGLGKET